MNILGGYFARVIMRRAYLFVAGLLAIGCSEDATGPDTAPDPAALKGVWLVTSVDGEACNEGRTFTFDESDFTVAQGSSSAIGEGSVEVSAGKVTIEVEKIEAVLGDSQDCGFYEGDEKTYTFTINGDKLSLNGDERIELERPTGEKRLQGVWLINKYRNEEAVAFAFVYSQKMVLILDDDCGFLCRYSASDDARCTLTIIDDGCGGDSEGKADEFTLSFRSNLKEMTWKVPESSFWLPSGVWEAERLE